MDLVWTFADDLETAGAAGTSPARQDPLAPLARAAASGDRAAMRALLHELSPQLLRVLRGVMGRGHPELQDVMQDTLLLVVRALGAWRGEGEVCHYANRIALRAALAARARHRAYASPLQPESDAPEPAADAKQPLQVLDERRRALIRGLLQELPAPQAEALVLRAVLGYSMEETALAAGAPLNTIRSRLRLAREALQQRIQSDPALAEQLEIDP